MAGVADLLPHLEKINRVEMRLEAHARDVAQLEEKVRDLRKLLDARAAELVERIVELEESDDDDEEDGAGDVIDKLMRYSAHPMAAPFVAALMERAKDKDWVAGVLDRLSTKKPAIPGTGT